MSCKDALGNVCTHLVEVSIYTTSPPNIPIVNVVKNAMRIYGPHGICIKILHTKTLTLTTSQKTTLKTIDGACKWDHASPEQTLLFSLASGSRKATEVRAFFVKRIKQKSGSTLNGCAGYKKQKPNIMIASTGSKWTFSHELGHVLLNPGFRPGHKLSDSKNLMHVPTTSITVNPPELTARQVTAMKKSKWCKPC